MADEQKFLLVDENADTRTLLSRTLYRKFPTAIVRESPDLASAVAIAATERLAAIVVHRTFEARGAELVRLLRKIAPDVPLIAMSGIDRTRETLDAGANVFLLADEWLRVPSVVADLISKRESQGIPDKETGKI